MRVYLFEEDPSLLELLVLYLKSKGHQVQGFLGGYTCSLYLMEECVCPADTPCAEAVIVNAKIPNQESFQILVDQARKGCKLPRQNKAVMSACFSEAQEQAIRDQGFSVIKKPFRLAAIDAWLATCSARLQSL